MYSLERTSVGEAGPSEVFQKLAGEKGFSSAWAGAQASARAPAAIAVTRDIRTRYSRIDPPCAISRQGAGTVGASAPYPPGGRCMPGRVSRRDDAHRPRPS